MAAPKVKYEMQNGTEIINALIDVPNKVIRKVVRTALRNAQKMITAEAKELAPVDTGALKRAIRTRTRKLKKGRIGMQTLIDSDQFPKASSQEYGTSDTPGTGYMRGAFDTKGESAARQATQEIRDGWEEEVRKARVE